MIAVLLLLASAGLLVAGAELFVDSAAAAASRLGVTVLAVAVLLAGAEPEELVTAVLASAADRPGLAVGDAVGANVTMLTVVLGLAALVRPLPVGRRTRTYAVGAAVAGLLAVLALLGGIGSGEGALLLLAYAGLVAHVWRREQAPPVIGELAELAERDDEGDGEGEDDSDRAPALSLLLVGVGLALMTAGGVLAVEGATRLVAALDRTDTAVGLTVLGLVTTAELFAIVLAAARRGVQEVAVAAVVGSAAYNATATLGAAALAGQLPATGLDAACLAAVLPLALVALSRTGRLGRPAGALLIATYLVFTFLVLG